MIYSFLERGKEHTICQDYVLTTKNAGIFSDGCSAYPHTDFGARFLVHALNIRFTSNIEDLDRIYKSTLEFCTKNFIIHHNNLFATLGFIHNFDNKYIMALQGDGYFFYQKNDNIVMYEIDCDRLVDGVNQSLPSYPLYSCYPDLYTEYFKTAPTKTVRKYVNFVQELEFEMPSEQIFSLEEENLDYVAGCSDGLNTFNELDANETLKSLVLNTKYHGKFLHRTYHYLTSKIYNTHSDDLGLVYINNL